MNSSLPVFLFRIKSCFQVYHLGYRGKVTCPCPNGLSFPVLSINPYPAVGDHGFVYGECRARSVCIYLLNLSAALSLLYVNKTHPVPFANQNMSVKSSPT